MLVMVMVIVMVMATVTVGVGLGIVVCWSRCPIPPPRVPVYFPLPLSGCTPGCLPVPVCVCFSFQGRLGRGVRPAEHLRAQFLPLGAGVRQGK